MNSYFKNYIEFIKKINILNLVRYVVASIVFIFFINCIIMGITVHYEKVIHDLATKQAEVIANRMYENRKKEEIKLLARIYSDEVLSKPIKFPRLGEPLLGERIPALNKEARKLKNSAEGEYCMIVEATAYWVLDPVDASGDGIAYDGTPAVPFHTIAVDPKVIPLQSEVFVPGVGWCRANDTGNAIKGRIIDIAMPTRDDAWEWGRKLVYVKIRPPRK